MTALLGILALIRDFLWSDVLLPFYPFAFSIWSSTVHLIPVVLIAVPAQTLFPATRRRPKLLSYEMWVDFLYQMQTGLLYMTALGVAVGASARWLSRTLPAPFPALGTLPYWLQVIMAVWLFDFVVYWRHRAEHEVSLLWPIHAVHHTSHQVDVLTTQRLHFLEVMAGAILTRWVSSFSGLDANALDSGLMIYLSWNYFIHTNVDLRFPWILKYVFVSPFMHRWHHGIDASARNRNFGVVFAWNDWLFRTATHPAYEPKVFGIDYPKGEAVGESYLGHQLYPFRIWALSIWRRVTR